ncbi:hypothetical protein [uncultured Clostridium sp.]|uniref:hypothetical protein n=1 Tax=uncultured Clostridium sp. TaxID=59620 RepID=UPI0028E8FF7C|nr:hypothetical protein [uncultured Clostridium sp.]
MWFLFLLILCSSLCIIYYLNNKIFIQKREIMILQKQNKELKDRLNKQNKSLDDMLIQDKEDI